MQPARKRRDRTRYEHGSHKQSKSTKRTYLGNKKKNRHNHLLHKAKNEKITKNQVPSVYDMIHMRNARYFTKKENGNKKKQKIATTIQQQNGKKKKEKRIKEEIRHFPPPPLSHAGRRLGRFPNHGVIHQPFSFQ